MTYHIKSKLRKRLTEGIYDYRAKKKTKSKPAEIHSVAYLVAVSQVVFSLPHILSMVRRDSSRDGAPRLSSSLRSSGTLVGSIN